MTKLTLDVLRRALGAAGGGAGRLAVDGWNRLGPAGRARLAGGLGGVLVAAVLLGGTGYGYESIALGDRRSSQGSAEVVPAADRALVAKQRQLWAKLDRQAPRGRYIVIDQTHNRLYVKDKDQVLIEAVCSAGSGVVLKEAEGGKGRTWVFDTPRGQFRVLSKINNPVWRKPDWAFVEEGQPIPKNPADRLEYGTLGEHALYFGNGYMIHGTLYERLLGRSVSHGCIRLGKVDLKKVFAAAPVGTPIYIY